MSGRNIAYIRVSTTDQNLDRQLTDCREEMDEIYSEYASAKDVDRPELKNCLDSLQSGDVLHVHSIDRLARNITDLLKLVTDLNGKGIIIKFHKEHLTFSPEGINPLNRFMLSMLGSFAELERNILLVRQREGIEAAKKRGAYAKCGKKKIFTDEQIKVIQERYQNGESIKHLKCRLGICYGTIVSYIKLDPSITLNERTKKNKVMLLEKHRIDIREKFKQGYKISELASLYCISDTSIKRICGLVKKHKEDINV